MQSRMTAVNPGPGAGFPQPVVFMQSPAGIKYGDYKHKQSIRLGAAQIGCGVLCIILNVVSLGLAPLLFVTFSFLGHGLWCGVLFIITGAFGIAAGKSQTRCKIIAYMVLSIVSASFTIALLTCGILWAVVTYFYSVNCGKENGHGYPYGYNYPCWPAQVDVAMESCLAITGAIVAALSIWGSTLGCRSRACCNKGFIVQPVGLQNPLSAVPGHPGAGVIFISPAVDMGMPTVGAAAAEAGPPYPVSSSFPNNNSSSDKLPIMKWTDVDC